MPGKVKYLLLADVPTAELLKEVAKRCSDVSKPKDDFEKNYSNSMRICRELFSKTINLNPEVLLQITAYVTYFRRLSDIAGSVEQSDGDTKKVFKAINKLTLALQNPPKFEPTKALIVQSPKTGSVAKILLNKQVKNYLKTAFQQDMFDFSSTYLADASDILALAQAIYVGDMKKAYKLKSLDTNVREEIPDSVWNFLQSNAR